MINQIVNDTPAALEEMYSYDGDDPRVDDVTVETCNVHPDGSFEGELTIAVEFGNLPLKTYPGSFKGKCVQGEVDEESVEFEFPDTCEDDIPSREGTRALILGS